MRRGLTLVIVGAIVASIGSAHARATDPGADGVILFTGSPQAYKLYSVAVDGANPTRITQTPDDQNFASWSPDGTQIAFLEYGAGWTWLTVADPSGVHYRKIAHADYAERPEWSPDGKSIAFVQSQSIAVIHPDGTGLRILGPGSRPAWSPEGLSIATASQHELIVYDVATGGARTVTTVPEIATSPSWSPDGDELAFMETTATSSDMHIHVVNADGSDDHVVTDGFQASWSPAGDELAVLKGFYSPRTLDVVRLDGSIAATIDTNAGFNASWSPDGALLAYTTDASSNELVVSSADGAKRSVVVAPEPGTFLADPVWLPNGLRLLYVRSKPVTAVELYTIDPRDGSMHQLTDSGTLQSDPAWSPDGSTIAVAAASGIELLHSDGSFALQLTNGRDTSPSWSPDGSQVVFGRGSRLLETRVDRPRVRRLIRGTDPAWSPTGRTIAFIRGGSVWTVRPDGKGARVVLTPRRVNGAKAFRNLRWSPDGNSLLVDELVQVGLDLVPYVLRVDSNGSNVHGIAVGTPSEWSPDGAALVSAKRFPDDSASIVVTRPDGSVPNELATSLTNAPGELSWQPICTVQGDDGPNVLRASRSGDVICGLGGNDRIFGGPGRDRIFGGAGNDVIDVRGGGFDVVGCGAGVDTVLADRSDYVGADCEHVKRY